MISTRDPQSLIVQAARLYHEQGVSQPEIAHRLNVSQPRVSRWLKMASELGMVRTIVLSPRGLYSELEESVRASFGLRHVIVVESGEEEHAILPALGGAAAVYLEATLSSDARVGISSYSASLMATVEAMIPLKKRKVGEIVQVMGGVGRPGVQILATQAADRLASLTGAQARLLAAPGLVSTAATRDALVADPIVQDVAREWASLTDIILGIGSVTPSALLKNSGNAVSDDDMDVLRELGAVGDVAMRFFDRNGEIVRSELDSRVIGIGADELRRIPRKIAIAGGSRKFEAILGALRGNWVDVLITDKFTASRLLEDERLSGVNATNRKEPREVGS